MMTVIMSVTIMTGHAAIQVFAQETEASAEKTDSAQTDIEAAETGIDTAEADIDAEETGIDTTEADIDAAEMNTDIPAEGDEVEGFVVQEVRDYPVIGGTAVLFEHEKTGARLFYIANDDINRVFDLTFFTRAIDNTGLPHVFEHATLNGSEKYPSENLFFNLIYQTYNTFMNAFTYPKLTTYPVASLSEEQLLKYADFYTDSCLHPSIMTNEQIYREEAWRYRLEDMDAPLTIEGTVYSEMLGALTLNSMANWNTMRTLFPGSICGNISGGDPAFIPDMTWEDLKAYHDRYYHPSNCTAYLYGKFEDYTAFLRLLDEAFAPYEKQTFTFEDPDYKPLSGDVEETFAYPAEKGTDKQNKAVTYYSFVCPGAYGTEDELVLNTLSDIFNANASSFQQTLQRVLPAGSFYASINLEGPDMSFIFAAENINEEDAPIFRDTVDQVLDDVLVNGFDQTLVDGVMASLSLSNRLLRESSDVGVDLITEHAYYESSSADPFSFMDYIDALSLIGDWNDEGKYQMAIQDYLVDATATALVTTFPEPGLREQLDEQETQRLAQVKAGMSEEELQAIIDQTTMPDEGTDASEYVAQLQAVQVESLPEEYTPYEITDVTGDDGVRRLNAAAAVEDVGMTALYLDASGLDIDQLHWFSLYQDLIGELDTDKHTKEEIALLKTRYLYNFSAGLGIVDKFGTDLYHPYLQVSWIAMDQDLEQGYDLVNELLYDADFSDYDRLLELIGKFRTDLRSYINQTPYAPMLYHLYGAENPSYAYLSYMYYLPYYDFLTETESMMKESPEKVSQALEDMAAYFHNRTNAIAAYAGSEEGMSVNADCADAFFAGLEQTEIEPKICEFEKPANSTALIVDTNVQFNGIVGSIRNDSALPFTADLDAVSSLISDAYLLPSLRDQYGVYSVMHSFSEDGDCAIFTYRDPNIDQSFEVFDALPAFVAGFEAGQEVLDGYILSAYVNYAMPEGELSGAINQIASILREEPEDLRIQYMRELKSLTPQMLTSYADLYADMMDEGLRFPAGSASAIASSGQTYDQILDPFATEETDEGIIEDVEEGSEHYDAVQYVHENDLVPMEDEENFGVDSTATYGDLAAAAGVMVGLGTMTAQEIINLLSAYGLIPAGTTINTPLTGADVDRMFRSVSGLIGIPYQPLDELSDGVLTKGELAELIASFLQ